MTISGIPIRARLACWWHCINHLHRGAETITGCDRYHQLFCWTCGKTFYRGV